MVVAVILTVVVAVILTMVVFFILTVVVAVILTVTIEFPIFKIMLIVIPDCLLCPLCESWVHGCIFAFKHSLI